MDISNVAYSSPIKVKGVTELVDPYGLYGKKRPFSICIRSANCTSLMGLRYKSRLTGVEGVTRLVDQNSLHRWKRPFSILIRAENCISLCGRIIIVIIKRFSSKCYASSRKLSHNITQRRANSDAEKSFCILTRSKFISRKVLNGLKRNASFENFIKARSS